MNRIINDIRNLLLTALIMVAPALATTSCVNDYDDCPEVPATAEDPGRYKLQFQIVTRMDTPSRAADIEGNLEGTVAENFIDIKNIRYFIFDSSGKFLTDLTPNTETVAANESFTIYNVVANVNLPYFLEHIDDTLDFYILALANYNNWGMSLPTLNEGDDISTLFTNGLNLTVRPSTPALLLAATNQVPATERQRFPMAGLQRFTVNGSMLLVSTDGTPYDISLASGKRLNMLRSLAKIEIVDRINIPAGEVFNPETDNKGIRIKSAQINGFMTRGRLLPLMTTWNTNETIETQQVYRTSMPSSPDYHYPPVLNNDNNQGNTEGYNDYSMPFAYDESATQLREDKCPVYSCYVHEYSQTSITALPATQQPYFSVDIAGYTDPDTGTLIAEEGLTKFMRMASFTNGQATTANNLPYLLRNHIYRFEVTAIRQQIIATWTVCNMDQAQANIEFN